ncbi:phosphoadenosine phosphosulfate reductase [Sinirhodobacter sp. WL0062]|uniref:Phosphoadenosine phosphosulfate reductase n=1 Tax=Rhodobacter flavimaris TaxID=2907145 RepID=A0ABS8YQY0_9RHOB|nr:phosphoadenosine phosphosulfate reductase [Sinirhodobacter sp. WL0062]MCE5972292.1 phosphoadenosine phosphosulfate reductase [Sinirhodobacter sp. WL0062]
MTARGAPSNPDLSGHSRDDWRRELIRIGDESGFFRELGGQHTALHVRAGDTLVVTFENLDHVFEHGGNRLPWGFDFIRSHGWSILGLMAHDWTWYRDVAVHDFFDTLRDEGFFEQFSRVVFYGASMGGYAAAAFSAAAPGATVITISPQATLDKTQVPWETRYSKAWDRDFSDRYGFAPASLRAADSVYLLFDPHAELDANHAALFDDPNIMRLHCRMMGHRIASAMQGMEILKPVIESAIDGSLTADDFYRALRRRRRYTRYLKEMLARLDQRGNPWLMSLFCQHYLASRKGPLFRQHLNVANAQLAQQGRRIPGTESSS